MKKSIPVVVLLLSLVTSIYAQNSFIVDDIEYLITSSTAPLTVQLGLGTEAGANTTFSGDLVIPETVKNGDNVYTVTAIGDFAFSKSSTTLPLPNVTSVTMPNTIVSVGARAFIRNPVTSITFSNSLESLGSLSFFGSSVTDIELPATLVTLGDRAFDASTSLTNVTIAATTPPVISTGGNSPFDQSETNVEAGTLFVPVESLSVYQNDANWSAQGFGSIEAIPENLPDPFTVNGITYEAITLSPPSVRIPRQGPADGTAGDFSGDLVIPQTVYNDEVAFTVTEIADRAFEENANITSLVMPNTITSVGARAFIRNSLATITFGSSLETIGELAFFNSFVTEIILPASLTEIGSRAFDMSSSLADVTVTATTPPTVSGSAFDNTAVAGGTLFVPTGSVSAYEGDAAWSVLAFGAIAAIELPAAFTVDGITYEPTGLLPYKVNIPRQGPADGTAGDFSGDLVIPQTVVNEGITYTVTTIGNRAFEENANITSLIMPNTVTSIGERAFIRSSISSIAFSTSLETLGSLSFFNVNVSEVVLPATLTSIGDRAFDAAGSLTNVVILASTPPPVSTGGDSPFDQSETNVGAGSLFVPADAVSTYQNDADWAAQGFGSITAVVPVESITLSDDEETFKFGTTYALTTTILPANATVKNVTWSSDNEAAATVDNDGVVSGITIGTATITATTFDGGFTATFAANIIGTLVESVSLDDDAQEIILGDTYQLTATILPEGADNKAVTWTSSDESVATVSETGLVTAVEKGAATITVTTEDGGFTATFGATVIGPPVESVSLDDNEETLATGKTYQLTATVLPETAEDKSVIWSSDNESVATVSDAGLVTAVDAGTATITVTTVDGGRTATFVATVIVEVASVELNDDEETILVGETYTLTATVLPANAMDKSVTWRTSNETVATVSDQGVITGLVPGQSLITVTTVDGNLQDTFVITVETILSVAQGIEKSIVIYPNPATSSIHVKGVSNATLEMYDLSGSIVIKDRISQSKPFSLSGLKQGVYLVKVIDNENSYQTRLIIK